jgi:hypothetical protein
MQTKSLSLRLIFMTLKTNAENLVAFFDALPAHTIGIVQAQAIFGGLF